MEKMIRLLLVLLLPWFVKNTSQANSNLINKNVARTIDLKSQLVKITSIITIENTGEDFVHNVLVAIEPDVSGNLSYIAVKDSSKKQMKLFSTSLEKKSSNAFTVQMKEALAPSSTTTFILETIFTKGQLPYPSSKTQNEKQLLRYFGNHYFYSPYLTATQETRVIFGSKMPENYSELKPVTLLDLAVNYGPYYNIQPLAKDQLMVHYESNAPFLTITRLVRSIHISQWGIIAIEENIEILHTGAKLKGPFSRYDYQKDGRKSYHTVNSYKTILPVTANNIYYKDINGNISSSEIDIRKRWIGLELKLRYPLFGGWRSAYTLGYSVPSYQNLYRKTKTQYVLNLHLLDHVHDDMYVEELETSIILPIGASNAEVATPYVVERLPDSFTFKYLDYLGRKVIKLKKNNLVEQHIQNLKIVYSWSRLWFIYEPILLSFALYLLFIIVIISVRLDFSIHKPIHAKND